MPILTLHVVQIDANLDNKKLKLEKSATKLSSPLFKPNWSFSEMVRRTETSKHTK
jgi:hypothetical protein